MRRGTNIVGALSAKAGWAKARPGARRWLFLGLGAGLLALLLSQVSFDQLAATLGAVDPGLIALAFALTLLATVFRTLRFALLVPPQGRWLRLYGTFALMRLLNALMPLRSGEAAFVLALKKARFVSSVIETAPVWLMLRVTDVIALAAWLTVLLAWSPLEGRLGGVTWWIVLAAIVLTAGLVGTAIGMERLRPSTGSGWLARAVEAMKAGFAHVRDLRAWLRTLVPALAIWAALIAFSTVSQLAFATPLALPACILAAAGVLAVSLLPVNAPLDIGSGEAIWTGTMVLLGVALEPAIALAIGIRLVTLASLVFESAVGFVILALPETGGGRSPRDAATGT